MRRRLVLGAGVGCAALAALFIAPAAAGPPGVVTEFSAGITSAPLIITSAADGNLWFTEPSANQVARITPSGVVTEFSAGISPGSSPRGITRGPDGNVWFTEFGGSRIAKISPSGAVTEYSLPTASNPLGITTGPDGNLWFTESAAAANRIGMITTGGTITEFAAIPTVGALPAAITAGPDGALWFTELGASKIGRITTSGAMTEFSISSPAQGITTGPDGNLWFTAGGATVGTMTPTGTVTTYTAGITAGSNPFGIAVGCDGNLWFAEFAGDRVARIRPTGAVTEFSAGISVGSHPNSITAGPDGKLWFTESGANRVANVSPGPCVPRPRGLTVSPNALVFPPTPAGPNYPDNFSFQSVAITNSGPTNQILTTATADPDPPFFPTFGGTCNTVYGYNIPPGATCTFQFGFNPPAPGSYTGSGTISFSSGAALHVGLSGTGT
jgi:streptogramin lyase